MAKIRPFRGLRYDLARAGDPARLLAPPYDVIDAGARAELAARSEHNCVHVILPEGDEDSRYAKGAAKFRQLVREAMVCEPDPGLYVYHQTFTVEGQTHTRKGFVCLIELTRFGEGPVLPHERTLAGPKVDRLNLMRACQAHLELVFGLFSDPDRRWETAVDEHLHTPVLECEFDGAHHALYRVHEDEPVDAVTELLADRNIYIADGHHRYETMCAFREELESRGHGESAAYGMIYLSNLDDPGLVVLPTHRLVHGLEAVDLGRTLSVIESWFDVSEEALPADPLALRERLEQVGAERPALGLVAPGGALHVLRLRADFDPDRAGLGELPPALSRLDVVLLHELILERALGITKQAQEAKTNLRYFKSTEAALDIARGREQTDVQLVCFMNPTPVADVRAVCDSGQVMPQKSTFFYPKIPTGLVFYDLRPDVD